MGKLPFERIQRKELVREEATTDPAFGCKPSKLPLKELLQRCVIVVDKPAGPTSHQTSDYLKKILKLKKAGHSGTLDPSVTGVLPVAVGKGTRVVQSLLTSGKEYVCVMHLHKPVPYGDIKQCISEFVGKIKQLPPIKSAVKRQWRYRTIYYIEVHEISGQDVLFTVGCQAGTYIRKLCHDIGEKLKVGAHMAELRRTKAGPFRAEHAVSLQDITDAFHYYKENGDESKIRSYIHTIEEGVSHLPKVWVHDSAVSALCHGVSLKVPGVVKVESEIQVGEDVAVLTLKGELVLVGEAQMISKDLVGKEKGIAVKGKQVFMDPGVYPKM